MMSSLYIGGSQYVQHEHCSCMCVCVMCVRTGSLGYEGTCLQGCVIYVHAHVYIFPTIFIEMGSLKRRR